MLRLVLAVGAVLSPLATPLLKRRLKRGKEDPNRWREKLGEASAARPDGPLIWLHGVGVGEVMALRGLIQSLANARPELSFLVTSSARSSGDVFAKNMPPRTQHQYLPLDLPAPTRAFLEHWRPDLVVWSDQEIWPRLSVHAARRSIPQAYVSARITDASAHARARFGAAYGDLYRLLDLRHAQDAGTAANLATLMSDDTPVVVSGSLKSAAAPLAVDPTTRAAFTTIAQHRALWLLASSHGADESVALAAHALVRAQDPSALLIIAPRDVTRAAGIAQTAREQGLSCELRSDTAAPAPGTAVYIADTYGELGTWYSICPVALIGGTFDATQGHNPWEAAAHDCAILHGPKVANFAHDYSVLEEKNAAHLVTNATELADALRSPDRSKARENASAVRDASDRGIEAITRDLLALLAD